MSRDRALAGAVALHRQGALDQAEAAYRALLDTNPDDPDPLHLLGLLLLGRARIDAAIPLLLRAARLRPDHARIAFDLGDALSRRERFAEARTAFERAVVLDPDRADAWHRLGRAQSVLGDVAAARDSLRACLAREAEHLGALRDLAASGDTGVIPTLRRLHAQGGQAPEARMHLCFALAMALDWADDPDGAFPVLAEANMLLAQAHERQGEAFDRDELRAFIDARIARATPAAFARPAGAGVADPAPVFIVGMPRSGTTLVERILASHPRVVGIGEGAWLSAAAGDLGDLATVPPATVRAVAARQLALLRLMAPGAERIVDKTPDNLFHLAEAACLFPSARVIVCHRDPRDVCLSCHFQGFALPMPYANDLADCAFRVQEAARMAAHWRAVLPLRMLDVRYETLVANPEATIRAMLSFLDMPWDPACLRFHASGGAVTSASVWQVRRPLNADAVGRWRAYRDHLGPLLAAFGDADQPIGPKRVIRGILTVGGWTMASRILGFVRDILIASSLGAGLVADAFFVALRLPNLFRRLFGEGAFNAAFVPQFSEILAASGRVAARRFAAEAFSVMAFWLSLITLLGIAGMPWVVTVIAPGFASIPEKFSLAVELSRITFPYLVLICLAALVSGMLNALDRFGAASATAVLFNVTLIACLLGLAPFVATGGHALAWGVTISGVLQLGLVLVAAHRARYGLRLAWPWPTAAIRRLLRKMGPGVIGGGVTQLNLAVDVVIASLLPAGTVSLLYHADRIQQLPLGVIGTAIGTALLPSLSRQVSTGNDAQALVTQNRAIEFALILTLPAAAALIVIPWAIIWTLFGRGAFDAESARLTAQALAAYAVGLPAFVLIKVLSPGFFARGDTSTPVKVAMATVVAHLAMNLAFMRPLGHLGPPLATSLASILTTAWLWVLLVRRGHLKADRRLLTRMMRLVPAVGVMAATLWGMQAWLFRADLGGTMRLVMLTAMIWVALGLYAVALRLFGVIDLRELLNAVRRRT